MCLVAHCGCLASVLQLAQNFLATRTYEIHRVWPSEGAHELFRPQSPTSSASQSPTAPKKNYELEALQYGGDALYGVRLHDGA